MPIANHPDLVDSHPPFRTRTFASIGVAVTVLAFSFTWSATTVHAATAPPQHSVTHLFTTKKASTFPQIGDRGQAVRALQQALVAQGVTVNGGVDGIFGQGTSSALKTFQLSKGLVSSGVVNTTTAFLLGLAPSPALPIFGQRGASVRALQQALTNASIAVRGGIDGIFGAGTTSAVAAYQTSRGLTATGVVDITTAISLGIVEGSTQALAVPTTTVPSPTVPTPTAPSTSVPVIATPSQFPVSGDNNDAVKALQKALVAAGISLKGGVDGRFGAGTTNAVTTFQQNLRVAATGVVDQLTAQLLGLTPAPMLPKKGDSGDVVTVLQNLLITAGITVKGGADGKFGTATSTAISAFQNAQGLKATGMLDLRTALYLGFIPGLATTTPGASTTTTTTTPSTTPTNTPATLPTVFPVLGPCWFTDTWKAPRSGGRQHEGVDIIAKSGTPIYAVTNGTITRVFLDRPGSLGGNAVRLTALDGTYFHYAHLSAFAEGAALGATVVAGQVIGYVGSTGSSSTPHLHFEYHPGGGAASNPYLVVKPLDACKSTTPPTTTAPTTTSPTTTVPAA